MNSIIDMMLRRYDRIADVEQAKNIVKQCLQEIVLSGLGRSDFFSKAAFNGGTALRIFHKLPRFSEDLDFSVDPGKVNRFSISSYKQYVDSEAGSLGIPAWYETDNDDSEVRRAYLKGNYRDILLSFGIDEYLAGKVPSNEKIHVKIEADTAPVYNAGYETKFLIYPYPAPIRMYDRGSLFAGKIAAVLQRKWKHRFKGRDLYDYVFYIGQHYPINIEHLRSRLIYGGALSPGEELDLPRLTEMLDHRFDEIDYSSAKSDVEPFIEDIRSVEMWSAEFFTAITRELLS